MPADRVTLTKDSPGCGIGVSNSLLEVWTIDKRIAYSSKHLANNMVR